MSDFRGYSYAIVKTIAAADQKLSGVQLANVCVAANISVATVAETLGVSRQTVYSWFTGRFKPKSAEISRIDDLARLYQKSSV